MFGSGLSSVLLILINPVVEEGHDVPIRRQQFHTYFIRTTPTKCSVCHVKLQQVLEIENGH